jgi:sorbitol-specific phosphotransferase system component IIBC
MVVQLMQGEINSVSHIQTVLDAMLPFMAFEIMTLAILNSPESLSMS